jgi:hypothetical protein
MGWLPTAVVVLLGLVLLALVAVRVGGALRRTRAASVTLNTAVTGRSRRIAAGLAEVREWRESHRRAPGSAGPSALSEPEPGFVGEPVEPGSAPLETPGAARRVVVSDSAVERTA